MGHIPKKTQKEMLTVCWSNRVGIWCVCVSVWCRGDIVAAAPLTKRIQITHNTHTHTPTHVHIVLISAESHFLDLHLCQFKNK